jgi:hypothetical protein
MKNSQSLLILIISVTLLGCSVLPIKVGIKDNHFRFQNFKKEKSSTLEYIHLMCFHKKETGWIESKQYLSGEHNLWVKASISKRFIPSSNKEAFVNFKVNLDSDKSYILNRKLAEGNISIWIQELDTGLRISDVLVAPLKQPLLIERNLRRAQCESVTI